MDDIFNQMSNIIPAKYKDLFLISMVVGRIIQSLRLGTGLKGIISSIWFGTNVPHAPVVTVPPSPAAIPSKTGTTVLPDN